MDPAGEILHGRQDGLPRACGDGPLWTMRRFRATLASPRLRGWTRRVRYLHHVEDGFPAPAGMDPYRVTAATAAERLPRACGDGPGYESGGVCVVPASPRLRGWTQRGYDDRNHHPGFPAPAGMDPGPGRRRAGISGLPRACGDGPC